MMTTLTALTTLTKPNQKTIRLAGLFFLGMVVSGVFTEIFVRQKLIVPGNSATTATNILSHPLLYRMGISSDILMALFYLFTALALYCLLESVSKKLASVMVVFASMGSVLLLIGVLFEAVPLYLLQSQSYLNVISLVERQAFSLFFIELYGHGYIIGQLFFALWVLPLGILIRGSQFIPKIFGTLFVVETVFALLAVFVHFLIPSTMVENLLMVPGVIAEFSFMFWLLFQGFKPSP
jgi:hypothetical protein